MNSTLVYICLIIMFVSNVLSMGSYNNTNNAEISRENPTYLTPDGLTFAIWAIIYILETFMSILQSLHMYRKNDLFKASRKWICAAFLLNALWLPTFAYHLWWLSLLVICTYLYALYKVSETMPIEYQKNNICTDVYIFAGISINMAWVTVAALINLLVVSRNSNIVVTITNTTHPVTVGGNVDMAIAGIVLASAIGVYRVIKHKDIPYALATAWALFGIYRHQKDFQLKQWAIYTSALTGTIGLMYGCTVLLGRKQKKNTSKLGQPLTVAGEA